MSSSEAMILTATAVGMAGVSGLTRTCSPFGVTLQDQHEIISSAGSKVLSTGNLVRGGASVGDVHHGRPLGRLNQNEQLSVLFMA